MRFDHQSLWEISKFIGPMTEPLIHRDQGDVAVAESEDDRLRVVASSGILFRGDAGPDSKPVGSIGLLAPGSNGHFEPCQGTAETEALPAWCLGFDREEVRRKGGPMTITEDGKNLFVKTKDRESISLGRISIDKAGFACFIPTQGMSFTHQMLFELSEYVKNTGEAYAEHRKP